MLKQISGLGKTLKSKELKTINGGGGPGANTCRTDMDCNFGEGRCNGLYCIYEMV